MLWGEAASEEAARRACGGVSCVWWCVVAGWIRACWGGQGGLGSPGVTLGHRGTRGGGVWGGREGGGGHRRGV